MNADGLAQSIAQWIGKNAERESAFLTPAGTWAVDAHALLDHISDETGIDKATLGEWAEKS